MRLNSDSLLNLLATVIMKKKILFGLIILVAVVLVLILGKNRGWFGKSEGQPVTVEAVVRKTITQIVSASGKVQPVTEVKISPDVSGEIILLSVKEGDFVGRGTLLARINPDLYESAVDRVTASLNTSKANLANSRARFSQSEAQFINARASYNRSELLFKQNAISESEFDTAKAQFLVAEADVEAARQNVVAAEYQVKSAEAALKEARESLTKTNIFAPMDGTISRLDSELGERVVGTSQFAGTEIMRIANLNQMEVLVNVNENDIIRVNVGDTATITIDAYRGQEFTGVVTSIANSAKTEGFSLDQVTNFEVRIGILPDSYQHLARGTNLSPFRPGMSATVDIRTKREIDVISVPIQAVTVREVKAKKEPADSLQQASNTRQASNIEECVFLFVDGRAVQTPVVSGIQDTYFIQIIEGLDEGQKVITGPYRTVSRTLKDGDAVQQLQRQEIFGRN
jgi:HlyD family secretion protein